MRSGLYFLLVAIAAAFAVTLNVSAKSDAAKKWDEEAALRKADYVFLQSANSISDNDNDDYVSLVRYAHRLAPNDISISAELGGIVLSETKDSATAERAYADIRRLFVSTPDDYETGTYLSKLAQSLRHYDDMEMIWTKLDSAYPSRNEPALNLATVYLTKYIMGDTASYRRTLKIYNRLEDGFGVDPGISSYKIRAHFLKHDTAAIINELRHLNTALPGQAESLAFTGQTFEALEMADSALYYYDRACEVNPNMGELYLIRADFFKEQGDSAAYDREVFRALSSQNLEYSPKLELITDYVSNLYRDKSQKPRILQMFNAVLDAHPGEPELYRLYGAYLSIIEENDAAAEQLSYAVSLDQNNSTYWSTLIQAYSSAKNYDKAAQTARDAMPLFPDNAYFPLVGAVSLQQLSRTEEGIALLDSFDITRFENMKAVSNYYSTRADLLYAIDQRDSAFVYYEKALEANPDNYLAMNNAAYYISLSENPDLERAEKYSKIAVRAEPNNISYLDTYAWVCFQQKDYQTAKKYIDKVFEVVGVTGLPEDWKARCDSVVTDTLVSDIIFEPELENSDDDDEFYEVTDSIDVDNLDDVYGYGFSVYNLSYEELLEEVGKDTLIHAGDIYFMNGEPDAALSFWKAAMLLDKDNELLKRKVKNKTYFFK